MLQIFYVFTNACVAVCYQNFSDLLKCQSQQQQMTIFFYYFFFFFFLLFFREFVCVEVLWPSQPNGVMSSMVSLPNHTFTGQA